MGDICASKIQHVPPSYSANQAKTDALSSGQTKPDSSTLKIRTSQSGNIFERISSPISNQKIVATYKKLSNNFKTEDLMIYNNNQWRKVKCPEIENGSQQGICQWGNDTSKVLHGSSILYNGLKNNQYLVGGLFEKGKIKKNQEYFKIFQNGTYYFGRLNSECIPHGQGYLHISENQYYRGNFNMGVPSGQGEKLINGKKFIGLFKKGQIVSGKQVTQRGSYQGEFKNNVKHGKGILRMNSGVQYEGQFENNKKVGTGTLYDKNKQVIYQGQWKDDKQQK